MELVVLILALLFFWWGIKGIYRLFQRHNTVLIILYLMLLTPIALTHAFFLGLFGLSEFERLRREAEKEARKQVMIEEERRKLGR